MSYSNCFRTYVRTDLGTITVNRRGHFTNVAKMCIRDSSMEFLVRMEKEIEKIGSAINDDEKIDFVTRYLTDSASQW